MDVIDMSIIIIGVVVVGKVLASRCTFVTFSDLFRYGPLKHVG